LGPQLGGSYTPSLAPVPEGTIVIERGVSAQEFAPKLNRTAADVIRFLMSNGEMVTATMTLTDEQMELYALEIGADLLLVEAGQQEELELQAMFDDSDDDDETLQVPRAPVITVMGHVDHGKTTLLDRIRNANVVAGEAGGITQHIGAYKVPVGDSEITFLDTPGHEAFTKLRARGAQVTDIVVLMVAADDGVMPQTIEAINHAKAAEVPIVVALNKIDKDNADPQRVMAQLAEHELVPESWGGDTIVVEMAAQQGLGVDDLLEQLATVAELEELTANPTGRAKGIVLLTATVNLLIGSASAKWALIGAIMVPMLMQLGVSPDLTQAAYRVGDSSTNIITPLLPYFPLIVVFCRRYVQRAGIGTLVALMLPYSVTFLVGWTIFLLTYWHFGHPLGIGSTYEYTPAVAAP
jgi:translation initiation factor IF-2